MMFWKVRAFRLRSRSTETNYPVERPRLHNKNNLRMSRKSASRRRERNTCRAKIKVLGSERPTTREEGH